MGETELDRIRSAYRARDASPETPYRWDNPAYVFHMQSLERALLRALADAGLSLEGARVLDVGCGGGYHLHRMQEHGAGECHGVDLMENRIAAGMERYPTLKLRVGSATRLPYADGAFDLVTQFTCLSSIVDDDVRLASAREMRRVARGGWILSFDMRRSDLYPRTRRRSAEPGATKTVAVDHSELKRLFGEPKLLRRVALTFGLAQIAGRHALVGMALETVPALRSHLLGLWQVPPGEQ